MKRILLAALAAAAAAAAWAAPPSPDIPAALKPAAREALAATLSAKGVQIYDCRAGSDADRRYAWKFVAPQADLFDGDGEQIGLHGAGPFWLAVDGSRIEGKVTARAEAPTRGAIPWLLLVAQSTGPAGRFSRVTSIQRIDTVGGAAPADPCTPELIGVRVRTPYSATYRFFSLS